MTSVKVMLTAMVAAGCLWGLAGLAGCDLVRRDKVPPLVSPYAETQTWAVAPLRNESGSRQVDPLRVADHLTQQLETAERLQIVPVNRVLAAMESLEMEAVASPAQAAELRRTLAVDALLVGTVTAYSPYDPPKLGLALELYTGTAIPRPRIEIRDLTRAPTDRTAQPGPVDPEQPVSVVSGYYDAAHPNVRRQLQAYGAQRGPEGTSDQHWRRYRINMDLYTEFVSYVVSGELLDAEHQRLQPPTAASTSSAP